MSIGYFSKCGISQPFHSYSEIHKAYDECFGSFKTSNSSWLWSNYILSRYKNIGGLNPVFPERLESDLIDAVKTCSYKRPTSCCIYL